MAALKIGKYYITKKDTRFLLRKVAELTNENSKYKEAFDKIGSLLSDYEMQDNEVISIYCKEIRDILKEVE